MTPLYVLASTIGPLLPSRRDRERLDLLDGCPWTVENYPVVPLKKYRERYCGDKPHYHLDP
jgi:hypothetical protein